jgi:hypothetical protein
LYSELPTIPENNVHIYTKIRQNNILKALKNHQLFANIQYPRNNICFFIKNTPPLPPLCSPQLADPNTALHLTTLKASKYDNICPPSTVFGNKTTVGGGDPSGVSGPSLGLYFGVLHWLVYPWV